MQAAGVSGVQVPPPHRLATPVPPQVWPAGQAAAQSSEPPHPLPMIPQYWPPLGRQVAPGQVVEPQALGMPAPPQVWPAGQLLPQSTTPPQPSPIRPQYWPPGSVQVRLGVQPTMPQTWATPPPPQT